MKRLTQYNNEKEQQRCRKLIGNWNIWIRFKKVKALLASCHMGDIDSITLYLFALSYLWKRKEDGTYRNPVYVILQKTDNVMDIYDITRILEVMEKSSGDLQIGIKVAIALCLGGNDFLPKFFWKNTNSHPF